MSSFQSFKSFVKIEENNDRQMEQKNSFPLENQSKQQNEFTLKQMNSFPNTQMLSRPLKRAKKQGTVCNFISKVYGMLQEKQIQHIVCWAQKEPIQLSKVWDYDKKNQIRPQSNQNSFQILNVEKFEQIILPKYFKHSNMSSFVRQLNMYGFHKLRGDKGNFEFQHQKFQRNRIELLSQIKRKCPQFVGISSSNLEQNQIRNSFKNLKFIQDKANLYSENFAVSQQQIMVPRQDINENNLFPNQSFLFKKRLSLEENLQFESQNSLEKDKMKKIEFIEDQNNRLKKIKLGKLQKIKDLTSTNKQNIDIKFSKVIFSFLTLKLNQDLRKGALPYSDRIINQTQNNKFLVLNEFAQHIMSNQEPQSFQSYKKKIQDLLNYTKYDQKNQ